MLRVLLSPDPPASPSPPAGDPLPLTVTQLRAQLEACQVELRAAVAAAQAGRDWAKSEINRLSDEIRGLRAELTAAQDAAPLDPPSATGSDWPFSG
jgi:hypothetical protein